MPILADMNFCQFLIDATQDSYGAAGGSRGAMRTTWSYRGIRWEPHGSYMGGRWELHGSYRGTSPNQLHETEGQKVAKIVQNPAIGTISGAWCGEYSSS